MKELSIFSSDLESKIIDLISRGNEFDDAKKFDEAINIYNQAYQLLPEPKLEWEMISSWLTSCYFNAYFALKDYVKAKEWAELELKYRSSNIDVAPYIDIGMAAYELNQKKEFFNNFKRAYDYGKERPFKEYPKKYLDFFLEEMRAGNVKGD